MHVDGEGGVALSSHPPHRPARPAARDVLLQAGVHHGGVDQELLVVARGGQQIELSAREYALLEYLAHRQGQVVSRSDIWEHLYDQHDETTSNVVDVYIGYLRSKIDKDFEPKLIHTRRGQGYLLGVEA